MNIAYVLVQSTIGHEMEVLSDLLKIDLVKEAKGTFGYYDILVKIEASSENEIEKVITKKIRSVKNVNTTTTLSVISEQEDLWFYSLLLGINANFTMNMTFFYLATGVIAGVLGGIFLVSFFSSPETLFMQP